MLGDLEHVCSSADRSNRDRYREDERWPSPIRPQQRLHQTHHPGYGRDCHPLPGEDRCSMLRALSLETPLLLHLKIHILLEHALSLSFGFHLGTGHRMASALVSTTRQPVGTHNLPHEGDGRYTNSLHNWRIPSMQVVHSHRLPTWLTLEANY